MAMIAQYKHKGHTLRRPAGTALEAGAVVKVEDSVTTGFIAVADLDIALNEIGELATDGVFKFPLKALDAPVLGTTMYWDSTNNRMSVTAGALCLAGRAEKIDEDGVSVWVKINVR